jgi:hypothetical protein
LGPAQGFAQYKVSKYKYQHKDYDGQLRFGRIVMIPGLAFDAVYDSNVFRDCDCSFETDSEGRAEDFIFITSPSIHSFLKRETGDPLGFEFNYLGRDERFVDLSIQDAFNHYIDGVLDVGSPGGRTDIKAGGLYTQTRTSPGSEFDSNFNPRSKRFVSAGFADLLFRISQLLQATVNTRYESQTFEAANLSTEERDIFNIGGSLFWQYSAPLAFGVKYDFRNIDFNQGGVFNSDSDTHTILAAVRWVPTSTISTEVGVGYQDRTFDGSFSSQDRGDATFEVLAEYHPTERSNFRLESSRKIRNSTFRDVQSAEVTEVIVGWEQKLGLKMASEISGRWQRVSYNEPADDASTSATTELIRTDNNFRGEAALIYHIQPWLQARAQYNFRVRESNFDNTDFTQHIVAIGLSAVY